MLDTDRILTLDIGASRIVLAEFSSIKSGAPELTNYGIGRIDIAGDSNDDPSAYIITALRGVMATCAIKPAPLLLSLSGQSVFPRYVKLPPVSRDKIAQMIQYEAEQNVPFPIDEVVWDYQLMEGDTGEGEQNVMLVAVKLETVERLSDCVLAAGLEPEVVDVSPMALYNAVRYNYSDVQECILVLDIGARSSNLMFMEGRRIFSRSIPVAGNSITKEIAKQLDVSFDEAEALKIEHGFVAFGGVYAGPESEVADKISKIVRNVVTRLHAEVNRSINFYRSQQEGSAPQLVLLTGGGSITPHLDTFFREKLRVEVAHLNPFINLAVSENIDAEKIAAEMFMMGEVAGLGLRASLSCPVEMNLMPPDLVAKKVFRKRVPFFALAATGIVLAMLCWWVYFYRMKDMLADRSDQIAKRAKVLVTTDMALKSAIDTRKNIQQKAEIIRGIVAKRTQWVEIIENLRDASLDGMWLTSLVPIQENGKVVRVEIAGKGFLDKLPTPTTEGKSTPIEEYRDNLRKSSMFTEKTDITWEAPPGLGAYLREFKIKAILQTPIAVE
ncbi:MAG: type IV pilus assembly protein PilM [Kiritimatiellae bacterium]|nr:type IV pilus assembly protein PilM [Kiritimatiellia bacterium]